MCYLISREKKYIYRTISHTLISNMTVRTYSKSEQKFSISQKPNLEQDVCPYNHSQ